METILNWRVAGSERKSWIRGRIMRVRLAGAAGVVPSNAGTKNRVQPSEARGNLRLISSLAA
jgi:hypothetical protein